MNQIILYWKVYLLFLLSVATPSLNAQNWVRVTEVPPTDVSSLFIRGDSVYAGADSAVYLSTDRGLTWERSSTLPSTPFFVDAITVFDNKIFVGTGGAGVITSSNDGQSWQPLNSGFVGLGSNYISGFVERDGLLFAGTQGAGVFMLANDTWSPFGNLVDSLAGNVEFLGVIGDTLLSGAGGNGYIWIAPTGAKKWDGIQVGPLQGQAFIVYSVVRFNGQLYAGSTYGVHRSTDNGLTWTYSGTGIPNGRRVRLLSVGETIYATANGADTRWYNSTTGDTWAFVENTTYTYAEASQGGEFFAARGDGLWRSTIPTSVSQLPAIPLRFLLEQNYPNPFNPTTIIPFELPIASYITLSIYNTLGQEVATLNAEFKPAGRHRVEWNPTTLTNGVYFYRLQAGLLGDTKKLILLR